MTGGQDQGNEAMNFRIFVLISVPLLGAIAILFNSKLVVYVAFIVVLLTIPFLVIEKRNK